MNGIVLSVGLVALPLVWVALGGKAGEWWERWQTWVEQHWGWAMGAGVLALVLLNGVPLVKLGWPEPSVHDEFSYWLGADTLARGRLANEPVVGWESFETMYVLQQPKYVSIYPPGKAAVLAVGQKLGHPYVGEVLLGLFLFPVAFWALSGWVGKGMALITAWLATAAIGCTYWTHSYWGGQLAAFLGMVMVGAAVRGNGWMLGLAGVGLGFVRPWEAVWLVGVLVVWVAWRERRARVGLAVTLGLGMAAWLAYNGAVTGKVWQHPYLAFWDQYGARALVEGQSVGAKEYRHAAMEAMLAPGVGGEPGLPKVVKWMAGWLWVFRPLSLVGLVLVGLVAAARGGRVLLVALGGGAVVSLLSAYALPHYQAPYWGLLWALAALGAERLGEWKVGGRAHGAALVVGLSLAGMAASGHAAAKMWIGARDVRLMENVLAELRYPGYSLNFQAGDFEERRREVVRRLEGAAGKHLVFVRYREDHNPHREWVYNGAELREQKIVWARYYTPASRAILLREHAERQCWVLDPDEAAGPKLADCSLAD